MKRAAALALLLAGCAPPEREVVFSTTSARPMTQAEAHAALAPWPSCRFVAARHIAGRIPRMEITAKCRRVPAGDG